eukprot:scaffold183996_cov58-Attheya_sp.AAC.4
MPRVTPLTTRHTDAFTSTAHHPIFKSIYDESNRRLNNELVRLREIERKYNAQTQQHSTTSLHADCSSSSTSRPRPKQAIHNSIKRTSKQNYEWHLPSTCGKAIAKAVWLDEFMDGIALPRLRKLLAQAESIKEIAKKKPVEATCHYIETKGCWSEETLDSLLQHLLLQNANRHLRSKYFSGLKIQRKIDLDAPRLNLESAQCMRKLQTDFDPLNKEPYSHKCVIVSSSTIQRAGEKAHKYGQRQYKIPYRYVEGRTGGGAFYFNAINMLKFLFKAHGLDEIAKHFPVEISLIFDAAQLTKTLMQIMAGIKLVDPQTCWPITGVLLLLATDPNAKFQSVFNCLPLRICMGK